MQFSISLASLMIVSLIGPAFIGLAIATVGISRFIAAYPFGRVTDRHGRRPGLLLGMAIALIASLFVGLGMTVRSVPLFLFGLLAFGIGMNGVQQLRLAAAEMYPPERRATILGWVLTASLVGTVASPAIVRAAEEIAGRVAVDPLAMPWFFVPLLIAPALAIIWRLRPDPKDIAMSLQRWYPSYAPRPVDTVTDASGFGMRRFLEDPQRRLASLAMFCAQASMTTSMVATPIGLSHHGVTLSAIALSMSLHTAGMFGPSIPVGRIADRIGRRAVLVGGTIVEAGGAFIAAFGGSETLLTIGIILVGIGWCGANVASTTMIIDSTPSIARGRAVGLMDTLAASSAVFPIAAGPLVDAFGIGAAGVLSMAVIAPAGVLFAVGRGPRREAAIA